MMNKYSGKFLTNGLLWGLTLSFLIIPCIVLAATEIQGADGSAFYYTKFAYSGGDGYSVLCILPYDHTEISECTNNGDVIGESYFNTNVSQGKLRTINAYICPDADSSACPEQNDVIQDCTIGEKIFVGNSATSGPQLTITINNCNVSYSTFSLATFVAEQPDPVISVAATDADAFEYVLINTNLGGSNKGKFTISITEARTTDLTINFTLSGTALEGTDYANVGRSVVIPAGDTSVIIRITPNRDINNTEGDETVILTLDGNNQMATVTIHDETDIGTTSGSGCNVITTGNRGSLVGYPQYGNSNDHHFISPSEEIHKGRFEVVGGTNLYKSCYFHSQPTAAPDLACSRGVTEKDGVTNYLALISLDNKTYCLYKYDLNLSATSNRRSPVVLASLATEEPELEVSVVATDARAAEAGQDTGLFTISRTGSTASELDVRFNLGGSAENGIDYQQIGSSVVIPVGASSSTVEITPINDQNVAEGNETVTLSLIDPVNPGHGRRERSAQSRLAARVVGGVATITIFNNANPHLNNAVPSQSIPTLQEWVLILLSIILFMISGMLTKNNRIK